MRSCLRWHLAAAVLFTLCIPNRLSAQQLERERNREVSGNERQRERGSDGRQQQDRDESWRESDSAQPRILLRPDRDRNWYLGVAVEYRDHGAQVTRVERHSPAARAGLEVRDVVVTVDGYQVGRVKERLYPLDRELELRADRRGNVSLLVHDHRNGKLVPLPVRLEPAERRRDPIQSELLIGTITSRRFTSLAPGAVLLVRLLDVTDRRVPPRVIAKRTYRDLGPLPIPFELSYDGGDIQTGRKYAIDAEVTVNGFGSLRTPQRYNVLETEKQGRVNMELEPVRR